MFDIFKEFNDEHQSKIWFMNLLNDNGYTHITDTDMITPYCYFDIFAKDPNNHTYQFELKVRYTTPSLYTYGDGSILRDKYEKFKLKRELVDYQYLVSFFRDGYTFADIKNQEPYLYRKALTTETTAFESHKALYREFCHFKHNFIFQYPTDK